MLVYNLEMAMSPVVIFAISMSIFNSQKGTVDLKERSMPCCTILSHVHKRHMGIKKCMCCPVNVKGQGPQLYIVLCQRVCNLVVLPAQI